VIYEELSDLVTSTNWKQFKVLMAEHCEFLEKDIIQKVREKNFDDALYSEARLTECKKMLNIVTDKLNELTKGVSNG